MDSLAPRTLAFRVVNDLRLVVLYQLALNPSDEEWERYLLALQGVPGDTDAYRFVVATEGGHPTRRQLGRMRHRVLFRGSKVAIVSPSVAVRFAASLMALANPHIRSYLAEERVEAFDYLGLDVMERAVVDNVIDDLRRSLRNGVSLRPSKPA